MVSGSAFRAEGWKTPQRIGLGAKISQHSLIAYGSNVA